MPDELDDALLTRYLTGACPEDEQARIEERYFADDATFERLCALEDALIEQRLDGTLSPEQRAAFDREHADGPRRDRLLAIAAMRRAARDRRGPATARPRRLAAPAWMAAAAALVLAVGGAWLLLQNVQLRRSLDRARADGAQLQQQHDADGRRIAELQRQRAAPATADANPQPTAAPPTPPPRAVIATIVLRPGLLRGPQGSPQVAIAPAGDGVRLQLEIDDPLGFTAYRVELRTAAGDVRWTRDGLAPSRDDASVSVIVPAAALQAGEHELVLQGRAGNGTYEDAARYYFDVTRR